MEQRRTGLTGRTLRSPNDPVGDRHADNTIGFAPRPTLTMWTRTDLRTTPPGPSLRGDAATGTGEACAARSPHRPRPRRSLVLISSPTSLWLLSTDSSHAGALDSRPWMWRSERSRTLSRRTQQMRHRSRHAGSDAVNALRSWWSTDDRWNCERRTDSRASTSCATSSPSNLPTCSGSPPQNSTLPTTTAATTDPPAAQRIEEPGTEMTRGTTVLARAG